MVAKNDNGYPLKLLIPVFRIAVDQWHLISLNRSPSICICKILISKLVIRNTAGDLSSPFTKNKVQLYKYPKHIIYSVISPKSLFLLKFIEKYFTLSVLDISRQSYLISQVKNHKQSRFFLDY